MHRLFGLQKLSIEDVHNMSWMDLEDQIERWIRTFKAALKILFPGERRLCDRVFFGFSSAADFSFMEICKESTIELLNFVDCVSSGRHSPNRLFKFLEVFETLHDLVPEFESLFGYSLSLRNEAIIILKKLGKAIRGIFMELEHLIVFYLIEVTNVGGGLHPITQHVINYLRVVCRSRITLEKVFDDSSLSEKMRRIMDILESSLEAKSKCYKDPSLGCISLMNNNTYIFEMTKDNELGTLLGDDWFPKHTLKVWDYHRQYQKTEGTITFTQMQDYLQSKNYGVVGTNVNPGNVQEIEASSLSQPGERRKGLEAEIITIVIYPAQQFGNTYKIPPKDGFSWKEHGKIEMPGFKYLRSYYKCAENSMHQHVTCRAKKKVQQLGDNPNVFEVRYSGEHSCNMSLTMPSLFVPARQPVDMAETITAELQPASTSYSLWLSSSTPGAKLSAPVDGGHHPMIDDNILGYLVSAIRSQQIKVVNGDGTFSAQSEGTMELLESILASKSEEYSDPSLRHFFMMNNWKYLQVTNRPGDMDAIFGDDWLQKIRAKVQQNIELYQRNSWDKVLEFLKLDINDSMEVNFVVDLMKEKISLFNKHFTETCRVQCTWSVHDKSPRKEIIESIKNTLLPAYGIFIGRFQDFLKTDAHEYIEYGMFDIHDILDNLFLGTKKDK